MANVIFKNFRDCGWVKEKILKAVIPIVGRRVDEIS